MKQRSKLGRELPLHLMMALPVLFILIFGYVPMYGLKIAFERFEPAKGFFGAQTFVGLDNFKFLLTIPDIGGVVFNTVFIAVSKLVLMIVVPVVVSILLNEVRRKFFKNAIQTVVYLPHFLSWVILAGVLIDVLSPSSGIFGKLFTALGWQPVDFLGNSAVFPHTMIWTDIWKEFGYGTVVYLAAIAGISPELYEAAAMDGANRFQQILHITLPGIKTTIVLLGVLSLGNVLNAGFDQIFNLYNPQVFSTGDILDTLIYRLGLMGGNYSLATAVGMLKSAVSLMLVSGSYYLAYKFTDYRVF